MQVKYKRVKTSKATEDNEGWTLGKFYETNEEGKLIDNNNFTRLHPAQYKDYFLKMFIPDEGDIVRIKTKEEMARDGLLKSTGFPSGWACAMVEYYGKEVKVEKKKDKGFYADSWVFNYSDIAEILSKEQKTEAKDINPKANTNSEPRYTDQIVEPGSDITNKTIKDEKMETTIKVNGEVSIVTEEAVVQEAPKTDLEQNYKYVVEVYSTTGTRYTIKGFRTKKEVKEFKTDFFKDPSQIGYTLKIYKLAETSTTKVPVVTTKEK